MARHTVTWSYHVSEVDVLIDFEGRSNSLSAAKASQLFTPNGTFCDSLGTDSARPYSELARRHRLIHTRPVSQTPRTRIIPSHIRYSHVFIQIQRKLQFASISYHRAGTMTTGPQLEAAESGSDAFLPTTPPPPKLGGSFSQPRDTL